MKIQWTVKLTRKNVETETGRTKIKFLVLRFFQPRYITLYSCIHFRSIQSLSKFRPLVSEVLLIQFRTANEK